MASGIIIAPSLAYMEQAYFDARTFGWSRRPIIELVIPSTLDGTLAPRGRQIFSPLDLERTFGLIGGDIFHGALDLRQIFSARPMLGYADYRGPIAGLYLCGSGGHPGGGVTGAPGHNAAREILRDFKRKRIARAR